MGSMLRTETTLKECDRCKESLRIVKDDDRVVAYEIKSGDRHVCWSLPEDANLLVLED
jgi:hypothetical protein